MRRDGLRAIDFPDAGSAFIAEAAGDLDLAGVAFFDPGEGFLLRSVGAALSAGLHDTIVFPRGFYAFAAFEHIVRDWLFHIDILSGLTRPDRDERVPMVGRRSRDDVDIFVLQQLTDVSIGLDVMTFIFLPVGRRFEDLRVAIAERGQPHPFHAAKGADVAAPAAAKADDGHTDVIIGAGRLRPNAGGQA